LRTDLKYPWESTERVREVADNQVRRAGFNPEEFAWIGDATPPDHDSSQGIGAALHYRLPTFGQSVEMLWEQLVGIYKNGSRSRYLLSDSAHLWDLRDPIHRLWRPLTREWVSINPAARLGESVEWTRADSKPHLLGGIETLALAAQHPDLLRQRLSFSLPAVVCVLDDGRSLQQTLCLSYLGEGEGEDREELVVLEGCPIQRANKVWSCPMRVPPR